MNSTTTTTVRRTQHDGPAATLLGVLAIALLVIGGLNWALVGLFRVDLVAAVFGVMSPITRFIYILVGLAALVVIGFVPRLTRDMPDGD